MVTAIQKVLSRKGAEGLGVQNGYPEWCVCLYISPTQGCLPLASPLSLPVWAASLCLFSEHLHFFFAKRLRTKMQGLAKGESEHLPKFYALGTSLASPSSWPCQYDFRYLYD